MSIIWPSTIPSRSRWRCCWKNWAWRAAAAAARVRRGDFDAAGPLPLNTHGGLLSLGHSGVAGGLAHVAEAWTQLAGLAGERQIAPRRRALVHADGGVLSAHVSLVLQAEDAA